MGRCRASKASLMVVVSVLLATAVQGDQSAMCFMISDGTSLGSLPAGPAADAYKQAMDALISSFSTQMQQLSGSTTEFASCATGGAGASGVSLNCVRDLAPSITPSPASGWPGSSFSYNINIANVGGANSPPGSNGFTVTVPAGVTVPPGVTTLTPSNSHTPPASCVRSAGAGGATVFTCTSNAGIPVGGSWGYTFDAITGSTPGSFAAQVTLTTPDGNPGNDVSPPTQPVQVLSTCGNPYNNGTRPACSAGAYLGPDGAVLTDAGGFQAACCVDNTKVGETGVTSQTACQSYLLGSKVSLTFAIANTGAGSSGPVTASFTFPQEAGLQSIAVVDPLGVANYVRSCAAPVVASGQVSVACVLDEFKGGAQAVATLAFVPIAAAKLSVAGGVAFNASLAASLKMVYDVDVSNNNAQTCINVLDCRPWEGIVNSTCAPLSCDPCTEPNPTVYLSTGGSAKPGNAIWRIQNFTVGNMNLAPEFLCTVDGLSGQIGDIAVLLRGDIVILDTNGNLRYIPVEKLPVPVNANTDYSVTCQARYLFTINTTLGYTGFTGLSGGFRSDMLIATTGNGWVVPLFMSSDPITGSISIKTSSPSSPEQPINWACWYKGPAPTSGVTNGGGTDITPGP